MSAEPRMPLIYVRRRIVSFYDKAWWSGFSATFVGTWLGIGVLALMGVRV